MKKTAHRAAAAAITSALLFAGALPYAGAGDVDSQHRLLPTDAGLAARLKHLTLDDAIDIALRRNPDILRQLQEIQRNKGVYVEVRSQALPHLALAGTYTQSDPRLLETRSSSSGSNTVNVPLLRTVDGTTGADNGAVDISPLINALLGNSTTGATGLAGTSSGSLQSPDKNYQITLQVTQAVYAPGVPAAIRQARFTRDNSYYQLRETVDTTVNNVKNQFYGVLLDQALITIQEESIRLLESQLRDQQNRFSAGTVPRFDVLQAEVALSNQKPQLITARNNFRLAYIGLARSLGVEYGPDQRRSAPIVVIGNLDYHPQDFSAEQSVLAAKANRALLKQQRQNILIEVEAVRIAAAGYQPTVTANAGLELRNSQLERDLTRTINGWFFGGSVNWNIFDGLATYGRVKQAKATLVQAKVTYDDAVRQVVQEVESNYLTLQQSKELIASQTLNVSEAEEAVRLSQARLSAGAGTQLDVLQSQVALTQAKTTELQARYDYATALANFERVTATSTVYDETFDDPMAAKGRAGLPSAQTGAAGKGRKLPDSTVKTPGADRNGNGRPAKAKINASNPKDPEYEQQAARDEGRTRREPKPKKETPPSAGTAPSDRGD